VANKATREVGEIARAIVDDLEYRRNLLTRIRKGKLAPAVESLLWHYAYGKPKETVEHQGQLHALTAEDTAKMSEAELAAAAKRLAEETAERAASLA
jgi:hypothetical protein